MTHPLTGQAAAIDEVVIETLAKTCSLSPSEIGPDTDIAALGIDSMGLSVLAAHIEATFGMAFSEEQLLRLYRAASVRELASLVRTIVANVAPDGTGPQSAARLG
jgi:acyl carrier protein